jgi:hypothetical protein
MEDIPIPFVAIGTNTDCGKPMNPMGGARNH